MTEIDELRYAQQRARSLYPRSAAFAGAYVAGARAKLVGRPVSACPYPPDRGTWRATYRRAWLDGHGSVDTD